MKGYEVFAIFVLACLTGVLIRTHSEQIQSQQQQIDSLKFLVVMQHKHILKIDSVNILILETLNDEIAKDNNNRDSLISYIQGRVYIIGKYLGQEPEFQ